MKKIYLFLSFCFVIAAMTFGTMGTANAQCDNPIDITENAFFTEDFSNFQGVDSLNSAGIMPTCWEKIYSGTTPGYDPKVYNGTDAVTSGDNCLAITSGSYGYTLPFIGTITLYNAGEQNLVVLPMFSNDLTQLQLFFTSKMTSATDGTLEIGWITDATDASTFVPLTSFVSTTTASSQSVNFASFTELTTRQSSYIAFRWSNSNTSATSTCFIDDVLVRPAPPCPEPFGITVTNITDVSAQVSWTPGTADQNLWEISLNGTIISPVSTNPYPLSGLTAETEYEVNVRAICTTEDTSYWAARPVAFTTDCDAITVTNDDLFVEDFSAQQGVDSLGNTGIIPDCWVKIYNGTSAGYDPKVYNGSNAITAGDNCLALTSGTSSLWGFITTYEAGADNYIILPNVSNDLDQLQLIFTSKMSTDTAGALELGYFTDLGSTDNFVILTTIPSTTVASSQMVNFGSFQAAHGLQARIAFCWRDNRTDGSSSCYIDNITLRIARDCAEPTDITVEHISDVSAVVSWTAASPSQNLWEIMLNDSTIQNVTTNPYTLTDLTAETEYVVNVRAVCTDETSYWAAQPVTFTTACPAITVTDEEPFREGFESADLGCWAADIVSGADNWALDYGAFHTGNRGVAFTSSVFGDLTNMGGDLTSIMEMFGNMTNFGNGSARLTSPILDLTAVTGQVRLTFFRRQTTMMVPQTLYVYYRTSPSGNWILLQQYSATNDWTGEALTLPNPSATYQISFLSFCDIQSMGSIDPTAMMDPNAATNFASNIYLDDIRIGYAIVCNNPTDLTVSNVTTTSATVTWGGTADNWTVEYGPMGFTTGNGTTVTAQNPTYTFTGLTPGTSYDVHVRANCPENSFSDWVQTYFTTENEIGINENGSIALTLSPNPTSGIVRCTLNALPSNTRLQVLDVYGKLLMEKEVTEQTIEFDLTDKAAGLYFLRVVSDNKVVTTQKVIRR